MFSIFKKLQEKVRKRLNGFGQAKGVKDESEGLTMFLSNFEHVELWLA